MAKGGSGPLRCDGKCRVLFCGSDLQSLLKTLNPKPLRGLEDLGAKGLVFRV